MKYSIVVALFVSTISTRSLLQTEGIFELSQSRIIKEELEKKQAAELMQKEAEEEERQSLRDKKHRTNMIKAEIEAQHMLNQVHMEAQMTAQ